MKNRVNYTGKYYCDSDGNIYRNSRKLKPLDNGTGYKYVSIYTNGKRKNTYVHRIIATCFCLCDPGKNFVNHIDGDKSNNSALNLEWVTREENEAHASLNNLKSSGERNKMTKLSPIQVMEIIKAKEPSRVLGIKYGVSKTTILNIKNGKTHKYLR